MLNEINDNNTVEEVKTSDNIEDDASAIEAPTGMNKDIKDYLNPDLFNDVKTVSIDELEPQLNESIDTVFTSSNKSGFK